MLSRERQTTPSYVRRRSFKVTKALRPAPQSSSYKRDTRGQALKAATCPRVVKKHTKAARVPPTFFRLPKSVRRQIYSYLTNNHDEEYGSGVVVITGGAKANLSIDLRKIVSISRQITREATLQFYSKNQFIVEGGASFTAFLESIGPAGRSCLKSLRIEWRADRDDSDRRSTLEGVKLLRKCSQLEGLGIELANPDPQPSFRASKEVQELRKLRHLKIVELYASKSWIGGLPNLDRLREWLASEMTSRARPQHTETDEDEFSDYFWRHSACQWFYFGGFASRDAT